MNKTENAREMQSASCPRCGRLLALVHLDGKSVVQVKCHRCHRVVTFIADQGATALPGLAEARVGATTMPVY